MTEAEWLACADPEAAYAERRLPAGHLDPAGLAILADALVDAGCTDLAFSSASGRPCARRRTLPCLPSPIDLRGLPTPRY